MTKIYISDKANQSNIDLFKKKFPEAEIIVKKNYFVNDYMFMIDETMSYDKEQEVKLREQLLQPMANAKRRLLNGFGFN